MRTLGALTLTLTLLAAPLSCEVRDSITVRPDGGAGSATAGSGEAGSGAGSSGAGSSGGMGGASGVGAAGSGGKAGGAGAAGEVGTGGAAGEAGTGAGGSGGTGGAGGTGVHERALLFDGHNDLPWALREAGGLAKFDLRQAQPKFNTDIPRLRQGNVGAQFWSAYVPTSTMLDGTAVKTTLEQMDLIHEMVAAYADTFEMALSASDVRRIHAAGKIASLIGIEGGHSIDDSLATLNDLYAKGARYMTLSHNKNLTWVESANDVALPEALTAFGKEVVHEMNALGILVDISHISARAMRAVLAVAEAPLIASHSSAFALNPNPRNVPDDVLEQVAVNGGVVMVNFYPEYLAPVEPVSLGQSPQAPRMPLLDATCETVTPWFSMEPLPKTIDEKTLVNHIEHIIEVAGIEHVGIGSDFDGLPALPVGLEDVSKFPNITRELLRRGYSEADIDKILGENVLRVLEAAEGFARAGSARARRQAAAPAATERPKPAGAQ